MRIDKLHPWLLNDWGVKLGAALLATALWFHAVTEHTYRRQLDIPLVVQDPVTPPGQRTVMLANRPPVTARVAVVGNGKDLLRLTSGDLLLRVPPPSASAGSRVSVQLLPEQVENHTDLDVLVEDIVQPRELQVLLDRREERVVPVWPRIALQLAESHTQVGQPRIQPDSVRITGPRAQVAGIRFVETDSLFRSGVREDVDGELRLRPPQGDMVQVSTDRVHVYIDVQELAEYEILNVPVRVRGGPPGAVAEPSRVTVRVRGGADLIGSLDPEMDMDLEVGFADGEGGGLGQIEAPPGRLYEVRQILPARADVVVR